MRLARDLRRNGLLVMLAIVATGLGAGAGFYRWAQPRAHAQFLERVAAAPETAEGRLDLWLQWAAPSIHQRIVTARVSHQQPWLVTHVVEAPVPGEPPEVWGIEVADVRPEATVREDLRIVVRLPAPRRLARTVLVGSNARGVPRWPADAPPPDAAAQLSDKVAWLLREPARALAKDVEGASLEVRVAER